MPKVAGAVPKSRSIIYLDVNKYVNAVKKAVEKVTKQLTRELAVKVRANIAGIDFSTRPIRLADGTVVTDADRAGALLDDIVTEQMNWYSSDVLTSAVYAMKDHFKDSHVGVYYEYGTGTKVEPGGEKYMRMADWNPHRTLQAGAQIVTRSKDDGTWTDLGGNERQSDSKHGGRPIDGYDTQAYHWFENAFKEIESIALGKYKEAVQGVGIDKLIVMPEKYVLGRRR